MTPCIDHGCKGDKDGYARAWQIIAGINVCTFKHRRVYFNATGQLPAVVRHTCDNPHCINLEHLVGGTHQDNMDDMVSRKRSAPQANELSPTVRFPNNVVATIRQRYKPYSPIDGGRALAKEFGMSFQHVSAIIHKHVRPTGDSLCV